MAAMYYACKSEKSKLSPVAIHDVATCIPYYAHALLVKRL